MKTYTIPERTSSGNLEYIKTHLSEISPVKKITCYQDSENFILENYDIQTSGVLATIESWSGNVLLCTGLNCGYGGEGPHATADVLQMLGVPTAKVNLVFQYSSIIVTFGNTGEYENMYVGEGFFSHYSGSSKTFSCHLDETCKVNPVARKVYMLNPQTSRPAALFRCLEVMQPIQMEFITGNDNSLISQTSENTFGNRREEMPCNLIVRGKVFILYGFVNPRDLLSLAQSISIYCNRKSLYDKLLWDNQEMRIESEEENPILFVWGLLKALFRPHRPTHKIVPLEMGGEQ